MPSRKHLPTLLYLLEDPNTTVRQEVMTALRSFGTDLERQSLPFAHILTDDTRPIWEQLIQDIREEAIEASWLSWITIRTDYEALEQALINLSHVEFGNEAYSITSILHDLTKGFGQWTDQYTVPHLMAYMFGQVDYQVIEEIERVPHHDNLLYVLNKRRGSQMMISAIALILAHRLGMRLDGIFIQGHFLLLEANGTEIHLFNAKHNGAQMARSSAIYIEEAFRRNCLTLDEMKATVPEMVGDILNNYIMALQDRNARSKMKSYQERLSQLKELTTF